VSGPKSARSVQARTSGGAGKRHGVIAFRGAIGRECRGYRPKGDADARRCWRLASGQGPVKSAQRRHPPGNRHR
jgi:hypothetical protein